MAPAEEFGQCRDPADNAETIDDGGEGDDEGECFRINHGFLGFSEILIPEEGVGQVRACRFRRIDAGPVILQ